MKFNITLLPQIEIEKYTFYWIVYTREKEEHRESAESKKHFECSETGSWAAT